MSKEAMKLALEARIIHPEKVAAILEAFAALVRADEREACLNCYSPDDTATDWADKIRARSNT